MGLADHRRAGEGPADQEQQGAGQAAGGGLGGEKLEEGGRNIVQAGPGGLPAADGEHRGDQHHRHRHDHHHRLGGVGPHRGAQAAGKAVAEHHHRADDGAGAQVPVEQRLQRLAAGLELGRRVDPQQQHGDQRRHHLEHLEMAAAPARQQFRNGQGAAFLGHLADFTGNQGGGHPVAQNPAHHHGERRQAGGVGVADHADEHETGVVGGHRGQADQRRRHGAAGEQIVGLLLGTNQDR